MEMPGALAEATAARDAVAGDSRAALVIALGRAYHQAGVPSDQLEELMHAAAAVLGLELQVTALPTSITAALGPAAAQRVVLLRLEPGAIDLRRLALLNVVFDRILARHMSADIALHEVERVAGFSHLARPERAVFAYSVLSGGVACVLGGGRHELLASLLIGAAVGLVSVAARSSAAIDRIFEVLAGFVATAIVTLFATFVAPLIVYIPIVAGVVQVLPGLALTAALHELAARNLVAGTARLGGVLMTLLSLGCGFALGIAVVGPQALHVTRIAYAPVSWASLGLAVLGIATGIALLENARVQDYPWVLGSCAAAELAYRIFATSPAFQVATFGAALVVGLLANVGARVGRLPQAVLLVPGLITIVPGSLSYESILFVVQRDASDAGSIALNAVVAAVEIVAGLLLAQLFVAPRRRPLAPLR